MLEGSVLVDSETAERHPSLEWWPWPRPASDSWVPESPMLLVPGVCGTMLHVRRPGDKGQGSRAWVAIHNSDAAYKQLWGRYNHQRGQVELLEEGAEIIIPTKGPGDEDGGLYCMDILDPEIYVPLRVLFYYHDLIQNFTAKRGYVAGKSLFGFGYDFRQSNASHCEQLLARLEEISRKNGGAKVDVVTHSMGGLVMRSFVATYPVACARLVRNWIAIAAPFGGAPGFVMDALLTGVQFAWGWQEYFFVARSTMHQVALQAPSIYEMFPRERGPWLEEKPKVVVWLASRSEDNSTDGPAGPQGSQDQLEGLPGPAPLPPQCLTFGLDEYRQLLCEVTKDNAVSVGNQQISLPMNEDCWERSRLTHELWDSLQWPEGVKFYNIYGIGIPAACDVTYGTEQKPLESLQQVMHQYASFTYLDGDGTVPAVSALADGLPAVERVGLPAGHRELLQLPECWELIFKWVSGEVVPEKLSAASLGDLQGTGAIPSMLESSQRDMLVSVSLASQMEVADPGDQWKDMLLSSIRDIPCGHKDANVWRGTQAMSTVPEGTTTEGPEGFSHVETRVVRNPLMDWWSDRGRRCRTGGKGGGSQEGDIPSPASGFSARQSNNLGTSFSGSHKAWSQEPEGSKDSGMQSQTIPGRRLSRHIVAGLRPFVSSPLSFTGLMRGSVALAPVSAADMESLLQSEVEDGEWVLVRHRGQQSVSCKA